MSLYSIYQNFVQGKITEEQAAEQFNISLKDFRFRRSRYGERLPQVLSVLDRIASDEISRSDAGAILQISDRSVNALQQSWSVIRPIKEYKVRQVVAKVKWEIRTKFACEFISGSQNIDQCAAGAGLSSRQMRRWIEKLIDKYYGITFKDLKSISLARLKKMADEIEQAEGLEHAKQQVLREVVLGEKAIEELAVERLKSTHSMKDRPNVFRPTKAS